MLRTESDPTKHTMEESILGEEEDKLKQVKPDDEKAF
jgi:hypothetical protein